MRVSFNGKPRETKEGATLSALLEEAGVDPRRAAVALNGKVVPRGDLAATAPTDGDSIEVIEPVGGG